MINKLFTFYPDITYDPFSVTARISKDKVQLCKGVLPLNMGTSRKERMGK